MPEIPSLLKDSQDIAHMYKKYTPNNQENGVLARNEEGGQIMS
jgi:hypothetical protein